jgi:nitrogenase molybdenum-iron protein alpha/beta subunit
MDSLIVYPENKEQLTALKAVMKAMKIPFEQKSEVYPDHVTNGTKESLKQSEEGQLTPFTGIREMLNLA